MTSVRREFRTLTSTQWQQFVSAVAELNAPATPTRYDKFTQTYGMAAPAVLGHAGYLPFLRRFLLEFEQDLQHLNAAVTLPYWNTALDAQAPEQSAIFSAQYAGGNGTGPDGAVASAGAFGAWTIRHPAPHQLARVFDQAPRISAWSNAEQINQLVTQAASYDALRTGLYPVDGRVHNGIGGDMAGLYSPNDPIFFLHSANIDRIWADWQQLGANAAAYGGANADGSVARSTDAIPVYGGLTVSQVLSTGSLGYSYQ